MRKFLLATVVITLSACGSGGSGQNGSLSSDPEYPNEKPTQGVWDPVSASPDEPTRTGERPGCDGQETIGGQEWIQIMEASVCGLATRCSETSSAKLFSSACDALTLGKSQIEAGQSFPVKPGNCEAYVIYCLQALERIGCGMTKDTVIPDCDMFNSSSQDTTNPPDTGTSNKCTKCVAACDNDATCIQACYETGLCP